MNNLKYLPGIPVDHDLVKLVGCERLSMCRCGGEPQFIFTVHYEVWCRVRCAECGISTDTHITPEIAAEHWNETMNPERYKLGRDNARFLGLVACALSAGAVVVVILEAIK